MKGKNQIFGALSASIAVATFAALSSQAQVITLTDNNSLARVDVGTQSGMFHWDIQGQNQLAQQWFWYRIGNNPEQSIDTIGAPVLGLVTANHLDVTYFGAGFNVKIGYNLAGGQVMGAGQVGEADITEQITINNTGAAPLDFHFFQYSDFDLAGPGNDSVALSPNLQGRFNEADQADNGANLQESITGVTPGASRGEVALFNNTLGKLNNGVPDSLNNNAGPVGPGDVTWALEWDYSDPTGLYSLIAPGGSKIISKDKHLDVTIVPEPSSLALLGLAVGGFGLIRKRRA